jgi:hypothetical protein
VIHDLHCSGTRGNRYEFFATIVGAGPSANAAPLFERRGFGDGFFLNGSEIRLYGDRMSWTGTDGVVCVPCAVEPGAACVWATRSDFAPLVGSAGDFGAFERSYAALFEEFHPTVNVVLFLFTEAPCDAPKILRRLAAPVLLGCDVSAPGAERTIAYGVHAELGVPHWSVLAIRLVDTAVGRSGKSADGWMRPAHTNGETPECVDVIRSALRGLFIDGADAPPDVLLETLLDAKRRAADAAPVRLAEALRELRDEVESHWRREPGSEAAVEIFYATLKHFDAYEALSGAVFRVAMIEGYAPPLEYLESLVRMRVWLEGVRPQLFRRLYFDPLAGDPSLGVSGRRRLEALASEIEEASVGCTEPHQAALHRFSALRRRAFGPRRAADRVRVIGFGRKRLAPPA